ncbi:hypothetical protein NDU88_006416 [Pleurodeles waltl]|uniref:Uncharacterized protein n=1 Tax=Pleurodeles waltl TaxID=8319 RepID=A0AAV7L410_PLEWA|nr:hypothetical protein NDU88_006416 [Pleurodeles waltl]
MAKLSLEQRARGGQKRLPPIQASETTQHLDRRQVSPIYWSDLYLPATRCPAQPPGIPRVKGRRSLQEGRAPKPPDFLPPDPSLPLRKKRWKDPSPLKVTAQCPRGRAGGGVWSESSPSSPELSNMEEPCDNAMASRATHWREFHPPPRVHKICVDLRAALENVVEPWGSWEGSSDTCSISGGSGTPRDDQNPIEEEPGETASVQTTRVTRTGTGKNPGAKKEQIMVYKIGSALPPPRTSTMYEEHGSPLRPSPALSQRKVSLVEVLGDGTLASSMSPNAHGKSPSGFPKVILQRDSWRLHPGRTTVAEVTDRGSSPRLDFSEDLQLPTTLLLQRVRDHTSSEHHKLIAQVLCSLRQGPGVGPRGLPQLQASTWRTNLREDIGWKTKQTAVQNIQRRLAPGSIPALTKGKARFTWQKSSSQVGASVPARVPRDSRGPCNVWRVEDPPGKSPGHPQTLQNEVLTMVSSLTGAQ